MSYENEFKSWLLPVEVIAKDKESAIRYMNLVLENSELACATLTEAQYVSSRTIDYGQEAFPWQEAAERLWPEDIEEASKE
jgi:hypothetical protein